VVAFHGRWREPLLSEPVADGQRSLCLLLSHSEYVRSQGANNMKA
jgi:hypothetical protein